MQVISMLPTVHDRQKCGNNDDTALEISYSNSCQKQQQKRICMLNKTIKNNRKMYKRSDCANNRFHFVITMDQPS